MNTKVFTVRFPVDEAAELELTSQVLGVPAAEIVRQGTRERVAAIRHNPDYPAKAGAYAADLQAKAREVVAGAED